jgi:hypothetical protein
MDKFIQIVHINSLAVKEMSKKLWVAYETLAKKLTDKVSIAGCSDVADFKGINDNLKL